MKKLEIQKDNSLSINHNEYILNKIPSVTIDTSTTPKRNFFKSYTINETS
jgi:hypothetical protein